MKKTAAAVFLMLLLVLSGCGGRKNTEVPDLLEPVGTTVDTAQAVRGTVSTVWTYDAYLKPECSLLYFNTDGSVKAIHVYNGQFVHKGDRIAELDAKLLEEQLSSAEEQIEEIKTEASFDDRIRELDLQYLRIELQELYENGASWQSVSLKSLEIEQAELDGKYTLEEREKTLKKLEDRRSELEKKISEQVLYAPHDGRIYLEGIRVGSAVGAGKTIGYLTDESSLLLENTEYVGADLVQRYDCWAVLNGKRYEIEYVPVSQDEMREILLSGMTLKSTFRVLPGEDQEELRSGQYMPVFIEIFRADDVLYVPSNAINYDKLTGESFVYVMNDGSKERRVVETGKSSASSTVITYGLQEGETGYVPEYKTDSLYPVPGPCLRVLPFRIGCRTDSG